MKQVSLYAPIEKFPLSIAWYTMFAGADRKTTDEGEEKQAYSSYVELNYPFSVKGVDLNATCGVVPYKTPQYNCEWVCSDEPSFERQRKQ